MAAPLMRRRKLSEGKTITSQAQLSSLHAQVKAKCPNKPTGQLRQCLILILTTALFFSHRLKQRNERSLVARHVINVDRLSNTPREIPAVYTNSFSPCTLTVVIAEPSLPLLPTSDMAYASSLESTAEFAPPGSCLVIQTSGCRLRDYVREHDVHPATVIRSNGMHVLSTDADKNDYSTWTTRELVSQSIRYRSGPHLSRWIDTGRVRLTLLNHTRYTHSSCDSYDVNAMWMSSRYYVDEFIEEDSDLVLFIQRDSFLCRKLLNLEEWRKFAYVGGPWTRGWGRLGMSTATKFWHRQKGFRIADEEDAGVQKGALRKGKRHDGSYNIHDWKEYWQSEDGKTCSIEHDLRNCMILDHPRQFPTDYPSYEAHHNKLTSGMVGNGGLSLRSRTWMLRAIHICPYPKYAQLPADITSRAICTAHDGMRLQEDVYFSSILGAIGAPLPTPLEAQLFCQDEPWSDGLVSDMATWNETVTRLFGMEHVHIDYYLEQKQSMKSFVSVAYHKCWEPTNCPMKETCKYSTVEEENFCLRLLWWLWTVLVSVWLRIEHTILLR